MPTHVARYARSPAAPLAADGHLTLLTDQSQAPVFLQGRVRSGPAFARAMLVLGRIVKNQARATARDHSAYQAWVQGEYLKELDATKLRRRANLPQRQQRARELQAEITTLEYQIAIATSQLDYRRALQHFYDWLYTHNRHAWILIDPVVSVQADATFFEGFSLDESIYGRVRLGHDQIEAAAPLLPGTTNIDFGVALEREFQRIRSYRPLDLTIGAQAVQVATECGAAVEKKIDLPASWVRGLVEVQSALMLTPLAFTVTATFLAEIISRLEARKETVGPRSLRFRLTPGAPIEVELEPWGTRLIDPDSAFKGPAPHEIRIWGRRRLLLLKDILPDTTLVEVRLLGTGMPSFWTFRIDAVELTVGLSGWTNRDWTARARFSALMPTAQVSDQLLTRSAALLKSAGQLTPDQLAQAAQVEGTQARGALQKLCLLGKALYDPDLATFRWRELFPEFDLGRLTAPPLEERQGIALHQAGTVKVTEDTQSAGVRHRLAAITDTKERHVRLDTDADGRITYAACTCSHFRHHKLREGPCRHLVALSLQ